MIHRCREGEATKYGINWDLDKYGFRVIIVIPYGTEGYQTSVNLWTKDLIQCKYTKCFQIYFRIRFKHFKVFLDSETWKRPTNVKVLTTWKEMRENTYA